MADFLVAKYVAYALNLHDFCVPAFFDRQGLYRADNVDNQQISSCPTLRLVHVGASVANQIQKLENNQKPFANRYRIVVILHDVASKNVLDVQKTFWTSKIY